MEEHLAANKVNLKKTQLAIGPVLRMDPAKEKFIDNARGKCITHPRVPQTFCGSG